LLAHRTCGRLLLVLLAFFIADASLAATFSANPKKGNGPDFYPNIVARLKPGDHAMKRTQ
jgi:hypothetical protein